MCKIQRRNRCMMMFVEMRLVWLWVMLVLASECYGCLEQERIALLQLKASINHPNGYGYGLPTWKDAWEGKATTNCCEWERVKCNTTTGRVIQLSLNSTRNFLRDWYLNGSMFLAFEELESLNLSSNSLVGWLENEGFEKLAKLNNLQVLDLYYNSFNNSILPILGGLRSLKSLNLSYNSLNGTLNIDDLRNLNNLMELDISRNRLDSFITHSGFEKLAKLNNLQVLDLSYNSFNNRILPTLGGLRSLKSLNLGGNSLKGTFNIDDLRNLNNLMELDISNNDGLDSFITHSGFEKLAKLNNLQNLDLGINRFNNSILPTLGGLRSLKSLKLHYNSLKGTFNIDDLRNLNNLMELDISGNRLDSFITHSGFERLPVLGKLEVLHLNGNSFNNNTLPSLAVLSSLKTLYLSSNKLNGSIDIGEFCNMSNLEELDLSFNGKYDNNGKYNPNNGIDDIKGFDGLKHLQDLYLDYSSIDMSFLYNVGVMSSLRVLTLRRSGLNGSLPDQGWCELSNLQELDLSENGFKGMLPSCLGDLTSIRILDISFNQFTGNLASSPLTNLTTLEYLILSYNHFEIPLSFVSFFNHSKLKVLSCDNNRLSDQIEFQTWIPRFQLQVFSLSNYGSNKLGMKLPRFLFYQYDLRIVDLSNNILVGTFPVWMFENNTRLEVLNLRNDSLTGHFLLPSYPMPHLFSLDTSNNLLEGPIPKNIGLIFPSLSILNMSRNLLEDYIPTSLGDMHSLTVLDLSNNNLSGQIPEHLAIGCSSLAFFKLSNNNLSGQISPSFGNLTNLQYLYLDNNHFVGKIPDSMSMLSSLMAIGITNNHMYGKLPRWMGNMSDLMGIAMFSNHFEGPIPVEFCKLGNLEFLDLSDNNLSGTIPSCFNQSSIRHVHLNQNKLRGPMTHAFYNSSSLVTLDLSDNNLTGTIPSWIGSLSQLSILLLKFNNFEGEIPVQLCLLKQLSILDLSKNSLFGPIPHCFIDIPFETIYSKSFVQTSVALAYSSPTLWNFMKGSKSFGNHDEWAYILDFSVLDVQQEVEFTTKHASYAYKGNILDYMSGVDLSCNYLTGEIPPEIGNLSNIHALNLSHNNLTGSIPSTFSYLRQIESLDLSNNNLNGRIPSQLIELGNLEVFSVAHNNLSGATPDRKAQFATFEENSYEGNSLLCGLPLQTNCTEIVPTSTMSKTIERKVEDGGFIDMGVFYVSFLVSYITVLLGIAAVLFINPHWRQAWFYLIEVCMTSWYHFVLDNFLKFLCNRSV